MKTKVLKKAPLKQNKNRGRKKTLGCGASLRFKNSACRSSSTASYFCQNCVNQSIVKVKTGLWQCKKCKITIAGNAYSC